MLDLQKWRSIVDRAGASVERYAYDGYGRPYTRPLRRAAMSRVREAVGRGDMDNNSEMDDLDSERVKDARNGTIWDPRADLDDDGDSDTDDADLFDLKQPSWSTREAGPLATVSQAFSDVDNRYAFQGVPHFVMDTAANATAANAKLILGHHRARMVDVTTGTWNTRDQLWNSNGFNLFQFVASNPIIWHDPSGRKIKVAGSSQNCGDVAASLNTAVHGAGGCPFSCNCKNVIVLRVPCHANYHGRLFEYLFNVLMTSPVVITIDPVRNSTQVLVDSFDSNKVDLSDIEQFPTHPPSDHPSAQTQAETWIHILAERYCGEQGGSYNDCHTGPAFAEQNRHRDSIGQEGQVTGTSVVNSGGQQYGCHNYSNGTSTCMGIPNGPILYLP